MGPFARSFFRCGLYTRRRGGESYVFIISHCGEFFLIFSEGRMPFSLRLSLSNNIILKGKGCLQTETKELLSSKHYKKIQKNPGGTSAYLEKLIQCLTG